MDKAKQRLFERANRARRIRKTISGTSERPRLCIRRSLNHISAQIFDDQTGKSLVQVGSTSKEIISKVAEVKNATKSDISKMVGELVAVKAKEKGIQKVVFDRKGYLYHGRVKALAEGARHGGLAF